VRAAETRQARENIEAVLRHYEFPPLETAARFEDRCFWRMTAEWRARLTELALDGKFRRWPRSLTKNHGVAAQSSWRENVMRHALQIVIHGVLNPETDILVECDIDGWNPNHGAGPALVHWLAEVVPHKFGKRADPYKIRAGLRGRGVEVGLVGEQIGGFVESKIGGLE